MQTKIFVGQTFPEMDVETADGQKTTINAHRGPNQSLIYFLHGTWCPECVAQYHLLQRYQPQFRETDTKLIVITGEDSETLTTFLASTHPPLEYTILTDPNRRTYHSIGAGDDTAAIIVDGDGIVRWFARWAEHQGEPGYENIFQALHDVRSGKNQGT